MGIRLHSLQAELSLCCLRIVADAHHLSKILIQAHTKNRSVDQPVLSDLSRVSRKPAFCICKNKDADQLRGNREADQHLCFRYLDSRIPLLLNPKFEAFSHLVWLYSLVCVGPGRKSRRPVFSQQGSSDKHLC